MREELLLDIYRFKDICAIDVFDVFKENYGLFKLKVLLKCEDNPLFIEKFNVIGWSNDDYFTLYETPSLNKPLKKFKINNIEKIIKIK